MNKKIQFENIIETLDKVPANEDFVKVLKHEMIIQLRAHWDEDGLSYKKTVQRLKRALDLDSVITDLCVEKIPKQINFYKADIRHLDYLESAIEMYKGITATGEEILFTGQYLWYQDKFNDIIDLVLTKFRKQGYK